MKISNLEQLQELYGEPHPATAEKKSSTLIKKAIDFIAKSPFIVLSTASGKGLITSSPKGDAPGFVYVQDQKTLLIPDRPGNKLIDGHKNIIENPNIGLMAPFALTFLFEFPGTGALLSIKVCSQFFNAASPLPYFKDCTLVLG